MYKIGALERSPVKPYGYLIISVLLQQLFYESAGTETQTWGTQPNCVVLRVDTLLCGPKPSGPLAGTLVARVRVKQKMIGLYHCRYSKILLVR